MKRLFVFQMLIAAVLFAACQAVFTYSPFTFLQRDITARPAAEPRTSRARRSKSGPSPGLDASRPLRYRSQTVRMPNGSTYTCLVGEEKRVAVRLAAVHL